MLIINRPMADHKKMAGFALVEVFLAVAILSIVFVGILLWVQRSDHRNTAQKIAQEFNIILGAATLYHNDTKQWPKTMQDLMDAYYLPIYPPAAVTPSDTYIFDPDPKSFQVSLCVPSVMWSHLIAPLLPYARIDQPPASIKCTNFVTTAIGAQTGAGAIPSFSLQYPTDWVDKPTCNARNEPRLYDTLMGFDTGGRPFSMFRLKPTEGTNPANNKPAWQLHLAYSDSNGIHSDALDNLPPNPTTGQVDFKQYPIFVATVCNPIKP